MRVIQKILLLFAMMTVSSLAVMAQKEKPPPKPPPPVIKPGEGKKPKDDKPKKPSFAFITIAIVTDETE